MAEHEQETQDQSIKDRKKQLFEVEPKVVVEQSDKSFRDVLRETPAAPLSGGVKAALWVVSMLVMLLLVAALMKGTSGPKPKKLGRTAQVLPAVVIPLS